jgi:HlyD family secretion protein
MSALWLKRGLVAAVAILVAAALLYALTPKPVAVDLATIERGDMRVTIDEEGKTRIKDVYVVSAPIAGKLLRNPLHVGDEVIALRTTVATIAPMAPPMLDARTRSELDALVSVAESAVLLARSELEQAKSESRLADIELERTRTLAKRGVVADRVLDRAETDAQVRKDAVKRAESALQLRQDELRSAQSRLIGPEETGVGDGLPRAMALPAPASGRVLRIPVESEAVVAQGTPLVEIGDPRDLEIVVDLLSSDAVKVVAGAEAMIEGWGGPTALAARVRRVEPSGFTKVSALGIEEQRVRVILDLAEPGGAPAALGHDYRVFVRILAWRSSAALLVPLGALFRDGDRWAVFKVVDNVARLQHVDLGHRNAVHAEVLYGLAAGDRVILHASDRVAAGVAVEPRESSLSSAEY